MRDILLRLEDVERHYLGGGAPTTALDHLALEVARGDYLSIVGGRGAGKTTLFRLLALLDLPDGGRYLFEGRDVAALDAPARARLRLQRMGLLHEADLLVPRLSLAQNVELPLILAGVPAPARQERVTVALDLVGLGALEGARPEALDPLQRRLAALARALVMNPPLLLADEPTAGLDPEAATAFIERLEHLHEGRGIALVVLTRDLAIGGRGLRLLELAGGRIAHQDALMEL